MLLGSFVCFTSGFTMKSPEMINLNEPYFDNSCITSNNPSILHTISGDNMEIVTSDSLDFVDLDDGKTTLKMGQCTFLSTLNPNAPIFKQFTHVKSSNLNPLANIFLPCISKSSNLNYFQCISKLSQI